MVESGRNDSMRIEIQNHEAAINKCTELAALFQISDRFLSFVEGKDPINVERMAR